MTEFDELATFTQEQPDTAEVGPEETKKKAAKPKKEKKVKEPKAPKEPKPKKEKKVKEPKPPRDNLARINGMTSILEVRKSLQIAIAKKAKAEGKPDTIAKYEIEIDCARAKLAEMLELAKSVEDLIAFGEESNRIITHFIIEKEKAYSAWLDAKGYKVSKRLLKTITDDVPESFFMELPIELHDTLAARHAKTDYRLRAACKGINIMALVEEGSLTFENGKWLDAEGKVIGGKEEKVEEVVAAEVTPEVTPEPIV